MLRFFGGPIHVTMRRYRFVEEGLRIGREEDEVVRGLARRNEKLWWRRKGEGSKDEVGLTKDGESIEVVIGRTRFEKYMEKKGELFFDGFVEMMEEGKSRDDDVAGCCAGEGGENGRSVFGARILSEAEREVWRQYALGFNGRLRRAFPEVDLDPALPV
ncbi:hypothetical protein CKM354_000892000 [Cercospora kikuchii]|uniref:Uncharacterized protein n=1 Tax=Cercospora kikuchii TaxID=84275 RepID=A0A9P3FIU6_9PEZI|nr:uncharacterized protein CKM354_000892000 [Cercospora kikuchii]GIZ45767.1 hypothetical protein CKM354_000892000 [Cercospora kikuchii]